MVKFRPRLFCLVVLLGLSACKSTAEKKAKESSPKSEPEMQGPMPPPPARGKPSCGSAWVQDTALWKRPSADFSIDSAWLDGKCLVLQIQRSGGCVEQQALLVTNGVQSKSLPPQRPLRLLFLQEDPCRGLLQETYRFEISTLGGGEAFVIQLEKWPKPLLFKP